MYLFRGGNAEMGRQSPEATQAHMQKWMAWMQKLGNEGKFIAGEPLALEGATVSKGGNVVTDGPFAEGKELVGGYLIVRANDLKEATEMSKSCPIFEFDGIVEVRPIQKMEM